MLASIMEQIYSFLFAIYWIAYAFWSAIRMGLIGSLIHEWIETLLDLIR